MSSIKEFDHLRIQLKDIKWATNNFGIDNYIGGGGFGKVYKGELVISEKLIMVAVKRLDKALGQGPPEFWKEIMMLTRYKHENLVLLLGFCDENGEKILVYEYLPRKSLDFYLGDTNLSWNQRLQICIGAARGLQYLHDPEGTQQRVLHRDIKSANILLDEQWKAKVSDFGLSKFGPANQQFTFLVSNTVGTFGYCDPLYMETGYLTKESDVYSLGVVLFEVLCGRFCIENYDDFRRFLPTLAQKCYKEMKLDTIVSKSLRGQISPNCLYTFSTVAYRCLQRDHKERPSVSDIVKELEIALEYQVSSFIFLHMAKYLKISIRVPLRHSFC
uniref:receptor-like protein kinase HERK 1 n=1 Tax=Erigeron canadensis TaxID=72917 RepID=UPI001CB96E5A|nr:receptor-like protein kinase HERK 1 [Erigeron canadensis]